MLAFIAGYVDAIGFLLTNGLFVSFMSGNSTRLGVGLIGHLDFALQVLSLIASFFVGAVVATLVKLWRPRSGSRDVLILVAVILAASATLLQVDMLAVGLVFTASAMGGVNLVHEANGEVRFGVTYMTGALVKAGQALGSRIAGDGAATPVPYLVLWLGLVAGAVSGASGYAFWGVGALWLAVAAVGGTALMAARR